eukprot:355623-Chlamydomonas_euryale.AAC.4
MRAPWLPQLLTVQRTALRGCDESPLRSPRTEEGTGLRTKRRPTEADGREMRETRLGARVRHPTCPRHPHASVGTHTYIPTRRPAHRQGRLGTTSQA